MALFPLPKQPKPGRPAWVDEDPQDTHTTVTDKPVDDTDINSEAGDETVTDADQRASATGEGASRSVTSDPIRVEAPAPAAENAAGPRTASTAGRPKHLRKPQPSPERGGIAGTVAMITYSFTEALHNLRRNLTITVAAVVTAALSLGLFGTAMLVRSGVDAATKRWEDGIEFIVFLDPAATPRQIADIGTRLDQDPNVEAYRFVDQQKSYEEFTEIFSDQPALAENVSADILPPSYRVDPLVTGSDEVTELATSYSQEDGVYQVVAALDTVRTIQRTTNRAGNGALAVAAVLLGVATILIVNTIRMAVYTRRREIQVMRLVGAGSWIVSAPFMVEGAVCGLIGGALAAGLVNISRRFLASLADGGIPLLEGFIAPAEQVATTSFLVVGLGAVIGLTGATIAVARHLRD